MQDNYELARKNLRTAAERQKKYYDERTKGREFQEGDWVLRFYPPKLRNKLNSPYIGPYKVLRKLGEVTYLLQLKPSSHPVAIPVDHLKLFRTEDTPVAWRTTIENDNGMGPDDAVMDTSVREENISHPEVNTLETNEEEEQSETIVESDTELAHPGNEDNRLDIRRSRRRRQRPHYLSDYDLD